MRQGLHRLMVHLDGDYSVTGRAVPTMQMRDADEKRSEAR